MEDTRLGTILLESRVIREEDLDRCLEIQLLAGGRRPLGEILVEERLIDSGTLESLLKLQQTRRQRALGSLDLQGEDSGKYLEAAVAFGANELHLSEGRLPLARVAGELCTLDGEPLGGPEVWQFVREHMGPHMLEEIAEHHSVTCEYHQAGVARGRVTAFRHSDGIGVNVRLHRETVRPLADMDIESAVGEAITGGKGLILLAGDSGNGITETFATLLHEAAKPRGRHIIVLDDCIEYPVPDEETRVCLRRVGVHTQSYKSGLRAALRSDPDAIFLGNASNPEAFHLALNAAESGTLVVAVVHGASATSVLKRVIGFYPTHVQGRVRSILASVLSSVIATRLVPSIDRDQFHCATEVLRFDDSVREIVRCGSIEKLKLLMRIEDENHGHPMDSSLLALLNAGKVSFEDVFPFAQDKSLFLRSIDGVGEAPSHG